jgi:hypothetical protein
MLKSFQALEKTSKNLRDSARRCSKTVVVTLFEKSEQHAVRTKGEKKKGDKTGKREAGRSKHPDDLLSTEMSMRPGLKGLVVLEPHFDTEVALEHTSLVSGSVLCCLSSLPWMTCMVKDPGNSWKQVFTWVLLPASKGSLQELTLTGCVFTGAEIVQLLEGFVNLKYLKLGGYVAYGCECTIKSQEHKKLTELDISGLQSPLRGVLTSKGPCVSLGGHFSLDLPGLQQLALIFDDDAPGAMTLEMSSFPRSLVDLRIKFEDSSQGPPLFNVLKLVARDCPLLQELHLLTRNVKYPEFSKCQELLVEIAGLPKECSRLEKLKVSQIDSEGSECGAVLWEYSVEKYKGNSARQGPAQT